MKSGLKTGFEPMIMKIFDDCSFNNSNLIKEVRRIAPECVSFLLTTASIWN